MGLSNDQRGWIMTCLSGIACVIGASIICIDIIVRLFPSKRNFRIQDSDTFLSASLSLSFGVMLFSALYTMLPSAKSSLIDGGFTPRQAGWILIFCFLGGVIGIQIISRVMHRFMPSHVVDCEHSHEEEAKENGHSHEHAHEHSHGQERQRPETPTTPRRRGSLPGHIWHDTPGRKYTSRKPSSYFSSSDSTTPLATTRDSEAISQLQTVQTQPEFARRPSLQQRVTTTISQLTSSNPASCGHPDGPCYGYSEPCGQECFKNINARGGFRAPSRMPSKPGLFKSATSTGPVVQTETTPLLEGIVEEGPRPGADHIAQAPTRYYTAHSDTDWTAQGQQHHHGIDLESSNSSLEANELPDGLQKSKTNEPSHDNPEMHHHHVPSNAFLSIGLQTSLAIALHKLPEGFITYATNHANPQLGVSVFLALFIHNFTEGFAMALPLYLALNNRLKAMAISFVLGGLSQPIGAAVAAVWFKLAGNGEWAPSEGVYGGMFAVTAGIMASVALQLFSESLDLTHSRNLCFIGAFTGMGILGVSTALTA